MSTTDTFNDAWEEKIITVLDYEHFIFNILFTIFWVT